MGGNRLSRIEQDFEALGEQVPERLFGLENPDNICYANSVLQSLYFCQDFRKYVLNQKAVPPDSLLAELRELYYTMSTQKKMTGVMNSKKLMSKVRRSNELFNNDDHHDSHEFFNWMINQLDEEIKAVNGQSWLQQLFEGKFTTATKCLCCENVTYREEVFMDLSLEVEQNSSLIASLKNYSNTEILSGQDKFLCDKCCCKQEAERKTLIKHSPNLLVCHLKRFKYSEELRRYVKLSSRVAFPSQLRLPTILPETPDKLYELFATVIHLGPGFQYGHYMSIVKSHGHWIKFDDDYIEMVDEKLIQHIFGSPKEGATMPCGYLLFYRAIN